MKQMYAIIESGGEYEDKMDAVKFITDDESKGIDFVNKMRALTEHAIDMTTEVNRYMTAWERNNPSPLVESYRPCIYAGQFNIAERKVQDAQHAAERRLAYEPRRVWSELYTAVRNQKCLEFPSVLGHEDDHTSWRIESVPWL